MRDGYSNNRLYNYLQCMVVLLCGGQSAKEEELEMVKIYSRKWFEYSRKILEAGRKAMKTHTSLLVRQENANNWYESCQKAFYEDLKTKGINTDAKVVGYEPDTV